MVSKRLLFNTARRDRIIRDCEFFDGKFSQEELDRLQTYCAQLTPQDGTVGRGSVNSEIRQSQISFFKPNDDNRWFFTKLFQIVTDINETCWGFDLRGCEKAQYTVYRPQGDHYIWHTDVHWNQDLPEMRKLSVVIPLADPQSYQGGEFQIFRGTGEPVTVAQPRGRVITFPSFVYHRVTAVTEGTRSSLVLWFMGPKFV